MTLDPLLTALAGALGAGGAVVAYFKWKSIQTSAGNDVTLSEKAELSSIRQWFQKRIQELENSISSLIAEKNLWQERAVQYERQLGTAQVQLQEMKLDFERLLARYEKLKNCPAQDCPVRAQLGGRIGS